MSIIILNYAKYYSSSMQCIVCKEGRKEWQRAIFRSSTRYGMHSNNLRIFGIDTPQASTVLPLVRSHSYG